MESAQHMSKLEGSVNELVKTYNKGVQSIINRHAPSYAQMSGCDWKLLGIS